ncbi:MAG: MBL fold metallo-hydrolase [Ornithinimicrobium sp.]|uniref:MBL fold metallo-hydrolase n=1 Tax=Ornithinimicrobium sp. TaxID=1977084 RepID=UPI0026E10785|nr:MBL fold metallo-hydrolase [Ornithinimicrobium sp.]MDO5740684.1 MBL fold metallo-hydrolase [Ornithinimicrobium sp.]
MTSTGTTRIDHGVTTGNFELDGGVWEVDNNVWVIGDDDECVVLDAPHDAEAIMALVGDRRVTAILLTHAHTDHVDAVFDLQQRTGAPIHLHPAEQPLWDLAHEGKSWDHDLAAGQQIEVAGTTLKVLHTPGHAPGACCFYAPQLGVLFSGDTLFQGGPGATGRSHSSFETIIESITDQLLTLPPETVVHTGHGDSTSIGAERPQREEWIKRGH